MCRLPSLLKTRDGPLVGRVPTFWAVKPHYTAGSAKLFVQKGLSNFESGCTWSCRGIYLGYVSICFVQSSLKDIYESTLLCNPSSNLSPPSSSSSSFIQTPSSTPASLAPAEFLPVTTTTSQVPHLWQQISKVFHLLCLFFLRCNMLVCF